MKITIMALHLGYGGVEQYIATLSNILSTKYDVEIISTYKIMDEPAFFISDKVQVKYLITNLNPNKDDFRKAIHSKKIFSIFRESFTSLKILFLKRKRNIKAIKCCDSHIIITTRDFHNQLVQRYATGNKIKIATEHNHHNNNEKYIKKIIKSCENFDYMIPISKELTSFYKEKLPKVKVLHMPFCIEFPKSLIYQSSDNQLISVGRLSEEKGFTDLIYIVRELKKEIFDIHLNIVGGGEELERLQKIIDELNLEETITLTGFLNKKELNNLYQKSTLYLMTSYTESFGIVLLEALSYGIPCVAFDSAQGAKEIIMDNYNGFLIHERNTKEYIRVVLSLLNNKSELKKMSANALDSIKEYGYKNVAEKWIEFIEKIKEGEII